MNKKKTALYTPRAPQPSSDPRTIWGWILGSQALLILIALNSNPHQSGYYRVHGALFLISLLVLLSVFANPRALLPTARSARDALKPAGWRDPSHLGDLGQVLSCLFALASLALIVNWSFLRYGGLRVGGAAAVSMYLGFRAIWVRWWRR